MDLGFYQLTENPFRPTLDGQSPLLAARHEQALHAVRAAIRQRQPVVVVTGSEGMGKTALVQSVLASGEDADITAIQIQPPSVSFPEIVVGACRGLGLDVRSNVRHSNLLDLLGRLAEALVREVEAGHHVVLVIDDAHSTPVETLSALHRLAALKTARGNLIQILLVGHPPLEERLREAPQLERQTTLRVSLVPLSRQESIAYLKERLAGVTAAHANPQAVFAERALRRIAKHARGKPRMLNAIGRNTLANGLRKGEKPISVETVEQVVRSFKRVIAGVEDSRNRARLRLGAACVAGLALLAGVGGAVWTSYQRLAGSRHPASAPSVLPAPAPMPRVAPSPPSGPGPIESSESAVAVAPDAAPHAKARSNSSRLAPPAQSTPPPPGSHRMANTERRPAPAEGDSPLHHAGRISVMSYPQALVFIDGRFVGSTPVSDVVVPVGPREVRVQAEGRAQSTIALVRKDRNRAVSFQFDRID